MKTLLFLSVIFLYSCSITREVKPFPEMEDFKSFETHSYGDERWDNCEEIFYVTYGITHTGDTLMVRKKHKYNCGSYDHTTWTD